MAVPEPLLGARPRQPPQAQRRGSCCRRLAFGSPNKTGMGRGRPQEAPHSPVPGGASGETLFPGIAVTKPHKLGVKQQKCTPCPSGARV